MDNKLIKCRKCGGPHLTIKCGKEEQKIEDVKNNDIKKEYVVRDAASNKRPGWIEDAEVWAKQNGEDTTKTRFFSFETDPKVQKDIACDMAKANMKAEIAGEIRTFIQKSLGTTQEGNASIDMNNPKLQAMKEYVDNTLVEKVQSMINGASVAKKYWEQREYQKSLGAKEDFKAYTCAVLIKMDGERLKKAIDEASNLVVKKVEDPEQKAKVQKALEKAEVDFEKTRKGEI